MRPLPALILFLGASLIGQSQQTAVQALRVAHRYNDQRVVFLLKKVSDDYINPGRDSELVESAALPPPVASQSGMQLWQWRNSEFWGQHQQAVSEAPRSQRWLLFAGEGRRFHFKIEKHLVAQMNCEAGIVAMGLVEPEDLPAFRQVDEMQYLALPDVSGAMLNHTDPVVVPALLEEFPETSAGSNPALEAALEGLLVRELPKVQPETSEGRRTRRASTALDPASDFSTRTSCGSTSAASHFWKDPRAAGDIFVLGETAGVKSWRFQSNSAAESSKIPVARRELGIAPAACGDTWLSWASTSGPLKTHGEERDARLLLKTIAPCEKFSVQNHWNPQELESGILAAHGRATERSFCPGTQALRAERRMHNPPCRHR